jgi:hypothetical protein
MPQANLLAGLLTMLDRVLGRNVSLVSGTARPSDPERGAGLTIAIAGQNGVRREQHTVWEQEFGPVPLGEEHLAARYARLMLPAAVWLAFQLNKRHSEAPLGTGNWRSYAIFSVAAEHDRAGHRAEAIAGYKAALDRDPGNVGALLNLGSLLLHRDPAPAQETAPEARLAQAGALLGEAVVLTGDPRRAVWFRARYLLAVQLLYASQAAYDAGANGRAVELATRSRNVAVCADSAIDVAMGKDPRLDTFLATLHDPLELVRQSAILLAGGVPDISQVDGLRWKSAGTLYNLACFYARRVAHGAGPDVKTRALNLLEEAISRRREPQALRIVRDWARTDPAFASLSGEQFTQLTTTPAVALDPGDRAGQAVRTGLRAAIDAYDAPPVAGA